jgi:uncharacterized protein YacL
LSANTCTHLQSLERRIRIETIVFIAIGLLALATMLTSLYIGDPTTDESIASAVIASMIVILITIIGAYDGVTYLVNHLTCDHADCE